MRLAAANVRPRGNTAVVFEKMIDEMAAGKTGGARDQRRTSHVRQSDATAVLRVVVSAERRVVLFDRTPPPLVFAVPGDRVRETRIERHLRLPPKARKFRGVE